jgi:hypothetical protein
MDVTATAQPAPATTSSSGADSAATNPINAPAPVIEGTVAPTINGGAIPSGSDGKTAAPAASGRAGIAPAIAKLFGGAAVPTPIPLNVSYRVVRDPNEIVTVFSDPKTGKEVAQFPPEILIGLAQLFDQETGVTLDADA